MNDKYSNIFLAIIPILLLGITNGYASFLICLIVLITRLFTSDKHTAGIFMLMYGGVLGGVIRQMFPFVPLYGLFLNLIGIALLRKTLSGLFVNNKSSILFLLLVFVVFGICYMYGPKTEFATTKFLTMLQNGVFLLLGYYALLESKDYSPVVLSQILIIAALSMITFDIVFYHMKPGGLFDFNWFRQQETDYFYSNDQQGYIVSYQQIGVMALLATSIFLSQISLKRTYILLYIVLPAMIILMSGARQAIFGLFGVLILRYALFNKRNIGKKGRLGKFLLSFVGILVLLLFASYILPLLNIDVINTTLQSGDEGRTLLFIESLEMFNNNYLFGLGFGGFEHFTVSNQPWPHNFFLEILCECGLFGMISLGFLVLLFFLKNQIRLMTQTKQGMFYFLIVSAIMMSFMVSADFRESIVLFCAIFANSTTNQIDKKKLRNINYIDKI